MAAAVGKHGIPQTVFPVEETKQQAETAVEQEAPEEDHGGNAHEHGRCRQVSCGKEKGRNRIGSDQDPNGRLFVFLSQQFL